MTCCSTAAETAPAAAAHPLTAAEIDAEIDAARAALEAEGKVTGATRFPLVLPDQHAGGTGATAWSQPGKALEDTDLTVRHSFGPTHLPRLEDWPVMPVDVCSFSLRPTGFFDRNPALDLPKETGDGSGGHCHV